MVLGLRARRKTASESKTRRVRSLERFILMGD